MFSYCGTFRKLPSYTFGNGKDCGMKAEMSDRIISRGDSSFAKPRPLRLNTPCDSLITVDVYRATVQHHKEEGHTMTNYKEILRLQSLGINNSHSPAYKMPDYDYIHREMSKRGMTLQLLWFEYCDTCIDSGEIPYQYISVLPVASFSASNLSMANLRELFRSCDSISVLPPLRIHHNTAFLSN